MTYTVSSGEVTVTAGVSYVDKAHELPITPNINNIHLTPKTDLTGYSFYIVSVDATNFRVALSGILADDAVFNYIIFYEI